MALPDGISNGAMMSSTMVSVEEAEARLLELIGLAEQGEDIVITHQDQPKVRLSRLR